MSEKIINAATSVSVAIVALCNLFTMLFSKEEYSWLVTVVVVLDAIIVLFLLGSIIYKLIYSNELFSDSFKSVDKWIGSNILSVTDAEGRHGVRVSGGDLAAQTSVGYLWENIELTFEAKVMNSCFGIVVRAQDEQNFFMFQLGIDKKITPHKRIQYVDLSSGVGNAQTNTGTLQSLTINNIKQSWIIYNKENLSTDAQIDDWNKYKVVLNKTRIQIYINGQEAYKNDSIIDYNHGRIGFRCYAPEAVCIANVKVKRI